MKIIAVIDWREVHTHSIHTDQANPLTPLQHKARVSELVLLSIIRFGQALSPQQDLLSATLFRRLALLYDRRCHHEW